MVTLQNSTNTAINYITSYALIYILNMKEFFEHKCKDKIIYNVLKFIENGNDFYKKEQAEHALLVCQ